MGLIRRSDWRGRLSVYLAVNAREPFVYGRTDCALFTAGAIEAMTGVDPAAEWRGRYCTMRGGLRIIRAAGFADHIEAAATIMAEVAPGRTRVGDIAVVQADEGLALGVYIGAWVAVRTLQGVGHVQFNKIKRAFQCGG